MMRSRFVAVAAAALAVTASASALLVAAKSPQQQTAQQPPVRDNRPRPAAAAPGLTGTGALGGSVTNEDGSRPVRNAYVVLIGTTTGIVKVSSSDNDGKFMFTALPADRYTVGVSKPPYLGTVAGARRPARPGTAIVVADAQKVTNVAVRMPMGAAITGTITDEKGMPAANVQMALQQWRMQGGERTLVTVGTAPATDDRGRYRFFGLQPGEYVVSANRASFPATTRALSSSEVDAAIKGGPVPPTSPPQLNTTIRYAPVFYPGTTRRSDAQAISVGVGDERPNVDFRLELVPTSKVDGYVVSSDGQPVGPIQVLMISLSAGGSSMRTTPDGHFSGGGFLPGDYTVFASGNGPTAGQFGSTTVTLAGSDASGIQLILRPALVMNGSLLFRGAATAPDLTGRRISIRNTTPNVPQQPIATPTNQTGAFTVSSILPGRYTISGTLNLGPTTATMTWALESVVIDGRDVTDLPIDITGENPPQNIVVTFTDRFQGLTGRITRAGGAPVSEHTIIVFPEDKNYWVSGSRRILTTRPGTDGRFTLSGAGPTTLPPGRYLLAAVTDIDRDEQFDPAFLAALVPAAVPISLAPGEKKAQDLVVK